MAAGTGISVQVKLDEITPYLIKLQRNTPKVIQATIERIVLRTEASLRFHLSTQWGPRSGREYTRRGVVHTASDEGEPPAPDTGNLLGSVDGEVRHLEGEVGVRAIYGAFLEPSRPFMAPSIEDATESIIDDLHQELRRHGA